MSRGPVWINGSFDGRIDPSDRGLTLGDGVFDTLVAFRGEPFAADLHIARLSAHAAAIGIAIDPARVRSGWSAVIGKATGEHLILRTTVTRGVSGRGLWPAQPADHPTIVVSGTPWSASLVARPVRLVTSTIVRNAGSPTSRLKTIGYLDNILAAREATEKDGDDALLLNAAGKVASTTIANLFILSDGRLLTPPAADGVMTGTIRGLVLDAAVIAGVAASECSLEVPDLFAADGVFLTNSVRLVSPVQSLDGTPVGGRDPERIAMLLGAVAEKIRDEHGFDPRTG
jgi:branched-chain amino acid aminotransferase